jgi:hypothetical protein
MKGILFKPEMIQAIVEGRKTQTRRLSGLKEINKEPSEWNISKWHLDSMGGRQYRFDSAEEWLIIKPRYRAGETVYIKEAWQVTDLMYDDYNGGWEAGYPLKQIPRVKPDYKVAIFYKADNDEGTFRSPLFMPAWTARYFIQITDVRAERLQDIAKHQEDAIAEGVLFMGGIADNLDEAPWCASLNDQEPMKYPSAAYGRLWNSINKIKWDSNPWVWVYSFKARK